MEHLVAGRGTPRLEAEAPAGHETLLDTGTHTTPTVHSPTQLLSHPVLHPRAVTPHTRSQPRVHACWHSRAPTPPHSISTRSHHGQPQPSGFAESCWRPGPLRAWGQLSPCKQVKKLRPQPLGPEPSALVLGEDISCGHGAPPAARDRDPWLTPGLAGDLQPGPPRRQTQPLPSRCPGSSGPSQRPACARVADGGSRGQGRGRPAMLLLPQDTRYQMDLRAATVGGDAIWELLTRSLSCGPCQGHQGGSPGTVRPLGAASSGDPPGGPRVNSEACPKSGGGARGE